mmetsp:Transcript_24322/g.63876  ORF Transcript_24322/g.63876 Transcript_24322/m.63876 type:complete len:227 (+) Transcript_24322:1110-1790(+)
MLLMVSSPKASAARAERRTALITLKDVSTTSSSSKLQSVSMTSESRCAERAWRGITGEAGIKGETVEAAHWTHSVEVDCTSSTLSPSPSSTLRAMASILLPWTSLECNVSWFCTQETLATWSLQTSPLTSKEQSPEWPIDDTSFPKSEACGCAERAWRGISEDAGITGETVETAHWTHSEELDCTSSTLSPSPSSIRRIIASILALSSANVGRNESSACKQESIAS